MKIKSVFILGIAASLIFISAGTILSQEPSVSGEASSPTEVTAPVDVTAATQNEPEVEWVWGEVVSLDAQNKTFVVKYLDYENDQEREMTLNVDEKTSYENIKSIDEIKPKDTLSIDYTVTADSKNIAKNISLEKPEVAPPLEPGANEVTPENLQPPPATQE